MLFKLATLKISVPAICCVPKTRSPNSTLSTDTVPSAGAYITVLPKLSLASITVAEALFTLKYADSFVDLATSKAAIDLSQSALEIIPFWNNILFLS